MLGETLADARELRDQLRRRPARRRHRGARRVPIKVASPFDGTHAAHASSGRTRGVATSGIGRRSWLRDGGAPAHHLLDPATGRPAFTGVVQVTALAPSALARRGQSQGRAPQRSRAASGWLADGGVIVLDDGSHRCAARRGAARSRTQSAAAAHGEPSAAAGAPLRRERSRARRPPRRRTPSCCRSAPRQAAVARSESPGRSRRRAPSRRSITASVSMPSATTVSPRLRARSIVERTIASARGSSSMPVMNERSILISLAGQRREILDRRVAGAEVIDRHARSRSRAAPRAPRPPARDRPARRSRSPPRVSRSAGTRVPRSSSATCAGSSGSSRLRADRLTDISRSIPRLRQATICRSARSITYIVNGPTSAVGSISGMNAPGRQQPVLGVLPADERLHAGDAPALQIDLRLVVQDELLALQAPREPGRAGSACAASKSSQSAECTCTLLDARRARARARCPHAAAAAPRPRRARRMTAMPMLASTLSATPSMQRPAARGSPAPRRRRQRPGGAVAVCTTTANSSAPRRATCCVRGKGRRAAARATSHSTRSPLAWPSVLLISVKRSRSISSTATPCGTSGAGGRLSRDALEEQGAVRAAP